MGRTTKKVQKGILDLTPCEREAMDVLYQLGEASARDLQGRLPGSPHYSTVRSLLRKMEDKGRVLRRAHGLRYVYRPVVSKEEAARHALQNVINTFFAGSAKEAIFFLSRNPDLLNVAAEEGLTDSAEVIREPTTP